MNDATIKYFGKDARVVCDRNCAKAWGISQRPRHQITDIEDDYYWLADGEIDEEAPKRPGTYEGGCTKPTSPDDFPNKWCVRECERSSMRFIEDGNHKDLRPRDFSVRIYNMRGADGRLPQEGAQSAMDYDWLGACRSPYNHVFVKTLTNERWALCVSKARPLDYYRESKKDCPECAERLEYIQMAQ